MEKKSEIPEQQNVPWSVALRTGVGGLRRRVGRSVVTMLGVLLAIALLSYMLVTGDLTRGLVAVNDAGLNALLQKAGVDILSADRSDPMTALLIGLSLVTCLVGIVNSMLMSVSERLKEIGTLKCLGATDAFIVRVFFIESILVGLAGTAAGMLAGTAVAVAVGVWSYGGFALKYLPPGPVAFSLLTALLAGTVISVAAAIAPAIWAARQEPVNAMRTEE